VEAQKAQDGSLAFLALTRENAKSWALMPEYLRRVREFILEFDPEGSPDFLCRAVMQQFIADEPQMFFPVALRDGCIIGHGLVEITGHHLRKYATTTQMKFDEPLQVELIPGLVDAGQDWAWAHGCCQFHAFVDPGPHERRLRLHGFRPRKIIMSKDL
jgi:hypothetical protein